MKNERRFLDDDIYFGLQAFVCVVSAWLLYSSPGLSYHSLCNPGIKQYCRSGLFVLIARRLDLNKAT